MSNPSQLISDLKEFQIEIKSVTGNISKNASSQIQSKEILKSIESISERWFNEFNSELIKYDIFELSIIESYSSKFSLLLELSNKRPSKTIVLEILQKLVDSFNKEIIIQFITNSKKTSQEKIFIELLQTLKDKELEYIKEAIECAEINKYRASIIMGWCCAVYRIHNTVEKLGFDKFNQASVTMKNIQQGRYGRFNKSFSITNISELRMNVMDRDLLWIIEFLHLIDGNEHEKLEICFTMRNMSAHPGDATMTFDNVKSFFSDLKTVIFDNSKFQLTVKS